MDESTLDRFRIGTIPMDYDPEIEKALCPDDEMRTRLQGYRQRVFDFKLERIVSTRFLEQAYMMKDKAGWSDERVDEQLFQGWNEDEVRRVKGGGW